MEKPHIAPVHKPASTLVYNANGNDVDTVLVDGKVVVKAKRSVFVDEEALIEECQNRIKAVKSIRKKLEYSQGLSLDSKPHRHT